MPKAKAQKNGSYGFKAVMVRDDGTTRVCHTKNWATREEAVEYAERFIKANHGGNPASETSGPRNGLTLDQARAYR